MVIFRPLCIKTHIFAQLAKFLDRSKFSRIVTKYEGDKYIKSYTYWNQLLTMIFGQFSNRESEIWL
ncbi:DUF4372 domain-containing protein [Bacteroides fluxus]|uniref:DUF4372 domain-containing protein n=1 Tax=Bacteroides fluxus YIT 12057 TaxID=763034 RepID=F3PVZ3_9BACE|nr:DUF4372 domain-containing protein [Bacteroides fluxus]EGF52655.1 hypothetical protein HMPREF9446_02923 [Bacteroides fluxus YIT 12057]